MQRLLSGKLIRSPHDTPLGDRLYYADRGKRHLVQRYDRLHLYGFSSTEVVAITYEELLTYRLAGPIPLSWPATAWDNPPRDRTIDLREVTTSKLRGSGIEFGAGTSPLGVPLECDVRFADFVPEDALKARSYAAQGMDFVPLSYVMGMEDMSCIADGSLDFVIAVHVIEHLRNPLRALEQASRKLRPGGYLALIVPDKTRSFDRDRDLTSLDHLVSDYEHPSAERDLDHYFDFFSKAIGFTDPSVPLEIRVRNAVANNEDLHFHTWTYASFQAMVDYSAQRIAPWKSVWSQPAVEGPEGFEEFYFVLGR